MPNKIKAVVFPKAGEVEIREFTLPPCGPEEIIAKTIYSMLSTGTELRTWYGHYGADKQFPFIPGYSVVAEVVEVGSKVTAFKRGDLVSGRNPLDVPGINLYWGAQASHHRYPEKGYIEPVKLPKGVDPKDYLIAEIAAISWRGLKYAGISAGENALVVGQGLIGALSAKLCAIHGLRTVVTEAVASRMERAVARGCAAAVPALDPDANQKIKALFPDGVDVLVEGSGNPAACINALQFIHSRNMMGPGKIPRLIFQANYVKTIDVDLAKLAPTETLSLFYPSDRRPEDRQDTVNFITQGKLKSSEFIGQILPFDQAPQAYPALKEKPEEHFSVAFDWSKA